MTSPSSPEELLLEAHEPGNGGDVWWVTLMFFVGFLGSFIIEKLVDFQER